MRTISRIGLVAVFVLVSGLAYAGQEGVVADNVDASFVGTWTLAHHQDQYGADLRYHAKGTGENTATWTLTVLEAGIYNVYGWWTSSSNRATNAPYTIQYQGGTETVHVSQQVKGGKWNLLGTYDFGVGEYTVVLSDEANGYVMADAVKFELDGTAPSPAYPFPIADNKDADYEGGWRVSAASAGQHGTDVYYHAKGTGESTATWTLAVPEAGTYNVYARWTGSSNRATNAPYTIEYEGGYETVLMSQQVKGGNWNLLGTFDFGIGDYSVVLSNDVDGYVIADAIRFEHIDDTPDPIYPFPIADNTDADYEGRWRVSAASAGQQGKDVYYHAKGTGESTAAWTLAVPEAGYYNVYAWWTGHSNRATNAPYTIEYEGGSETVYKSQQIKGNSWNLLGTYYFGVGDYSVALSNNVDGYVIADAIRFEHIDDTPDPTYPFPIADNADADYEGRWRLSTARGRQHGKDIYYHTKGTGESTATWTLAVPEAGNYDVYAKWTSHSNRATNAPYTVYYKGGSETVYKSQQIKGGCWNLLGTYPFGKGDYSVVLSNDANNYIIADAIKFVPEGTSPYGSQADTGISYFVKQGDLTLEVQPIAEAESAEDFYGYGSPAGANTGFERSDTSILFLYRDTITDRLSLFVIHDWKDNTGGEAEFLVSGLPVGASILAQDDAEGVHGAEYDYRDSYSPTLLRWIWWPCCTDGTVISDFGDEGFEITISPNFGFANEGEITKWVILSGGVCSPTFISLPSLTEPVTITSGTADSPLGPVADPSILWPANHEMVDVVIDTNIDNGSGSPVTLTATVASNEPQEGLGDGDTAPDWTEPVINQETGIVTLQLRAERAGTGASRVYTVSITATHESGNSSTVDVEIIVPHNPSAIDDIDPGEDDPAYPTYPFPIADNIDADYVGGWHVATASAGQYGADVYYHAKGTGESTATWTLAVPEAGYYNVYAWWTSHLNRATNAPYTINYEGGSQTVYKTQQIKGSSWNLLGTYYFGEGNYSVVLSNNANNYVIADAIKFERADTAPPPAYPFPVADNVDAEYVGGWRVATTNAGQYDKDVYYHAKGTGESTATWTLAVPEAGYYDVYAWWTSHSNRATNAPYTINHEGGSDTVYKSQQIKGSSWNLLGTYYFGAGNYSVILTNNGNNYVIADAIKFELHGTTPPTMYPFPVADNVDADYVGGWRVSTTAAGKYDRDVYYHVKGTGESTATWTLAVPEAGNYNVYAWWSSHSNRATNAPYTINHEGGSDTVHMSQQVKGGCWNLLGTYYFGVGNYSVGLTNNTDNYVFADAIKFELAATAPPPVYPFPVADNVDADYVGRWRVSTTAAGKYDKDVYYHVKGAGESTATWTLAVPEAGNYNVYAWWSSHSNRATNAPYTINYEDGSDTVHMSQQVKGGCWNLLGTYYFGVGNYSVGLTNNTDNYVFADAIKFELAATAPPPAYPFPVADNVDADYVGRWRVSTTAGGRYDKDVYYHVKGTGESTATWTLAVPEAGNYDVYAWWSAYPNRATNAPYTINYDGASETVYMNQQINGGSWNLLGTYHFGAGNYSVVLTNNANNYVFADAVKFVVEGEDPNEGSPGDTPPDGDDTDPNDVDTDGYGMPDVWEITYGLDPHTNDAAGDLDGDGVTNLDEFLNGTDPTVMVIEGNHQPGQPVHVSPGDGATHAPLTPTLQTGDFADPDAGDTHLQTRWQISRDSDFTALVLDVTSTSYLTELSVDELVLEESTVYYWRVAFYDNHELSSRWSEATSFATDVDENDQTGEVPGVPDEDEVDADEDLDGNGVPDNEQEDIKSFNSATSGRKIGLRHSLIEAAMPLDPDADLYNTEDKPEDIPYGLMTFVVEVENPGDETSVEIYLSKAAPDGMIWWKFDKIKGGWYDYVSYYDDESLVIFSQNRKKITLRLKDGGHGDADGVANGRIVDPSGLGTGFADVTEDTDTAEAEEEDVADAADTGSNPGSTDAGGGGGGCFIDSLANNPGW